jgi:hypothetical protein
MSLRIGCRDLRGLGLPDPGSATICWPENSGEAETDDSLGFAAKALNLKFTPRCSTASVRSLGRDGPKRVCLQSRDSVVAYKGEIGLSNSGYLRWGELFNGSPTS